MSGSLVVLERGARDSNGYRWIELQSRLRFLYFYYSSARQAGSTSGAERISIRHLQTEWQTIHAFPFPLTTGSLT